MRARNIRIGFAFCCAVLAATDGYAQQPHRVPLRETPIEAFGVVCDEKAGPTERTGTLESRETTYTGVVLSEEKRIAGPLTVWLTVRRDVKTGGASYIGRMEVRPWGFTGDATWTGSFSGDLEGSMPLDDPAALGPQIIHRRMISVTHGRTGEVRRLLHGRGALEGLELIFDFRLNEGKRPADAALPPNCHRDFELWKGAIFAHR
jgi:hypothetical protein